MDIVRNGAIKKRSRLQDDEMMQAKYLDIGKAQGSCIRTNSTESSAPIPYRINENTKAPNDMPSNEKMAVTRVMVICTARALEKGTASI